MIGDTHFRVLKIVEANPQITQRKLADELGVSLGKVNYCLKSLIEKGWIKASNFKNSKNKLAYAYLLTPRGIEGKAGMTIRFLKRKMAEYEALKEEIDQLRDDIATSQSLNTRTELTSYENYVFGTGYVGWR